MSCRFWREKAEGETRGKVYSKFFLRSRVLQERVLHSRWEKPCRPVLFPLFSFTAEDVLTENNNHVGRTKKAEGRLSFPLLSNDRANYGMGI
jgi:hypothetical protein